MTLVNTGFEVTKTDETKAAYLERTKLLLNRFQRESGKSSASELSEFVTWLINMKPSIMRSTWRQYKSSIVWFLEEKNEASLAIQLKETDNEGCKEKKEVRAADCKTSSRKKKNVTEREEQLIVQYLEDTSSTSFWSKPALAYFKAIMATGIRPEELQSAVLLEEHESDVTSEQNLPILKVLNAKNTNQRSHGKFRHLDLSSIDQTELLYLRIALQYANPHTPQGWITPDGKAETYHQYYKFIRSHIYRVTKKLFPSANKRVTLYSCRHQMIANLKKAKYSLEEIAALVGHGTDDTASTHYGRGKFGRSKAGLPTPNENEINKVRNVYQGRIDKSISLSPKD